MKTLIIVNPAAGGGKTGRAWPQTESLARTILGEFDVHMTREPGGASVAAREAVRSGYQRVLAHGGDGTCHEVVNGLFDPEIRGPLNKDVIFSFVRSGTGGDFGRTFEMTGPIAQQLQRIAASDAPPIDVLGCAYETDGGERWRVVVNIASVGQGGDVCERVEARRKRIGGALPFAIAAVESLVHTVPWQVRLTFDDGPPEPHRVRNVVVANGRYHGGGMFIAPMARPDDGLLEVVVIGGEGSRLKALMGGAAIYRGLAHKTRGNFHRSAARLRIEPDPGQGPMRMEMDGEVEGRAPLTFEVLPAALRLAR